MGILAAEGCHLFLVSPEDMLFATSKVRVDLAGEEGILGYVGSSGIFVEREDQEPDEADEDAGKGQVRGGFEHARIATQRQGRGCVVEKLSVREKEKLKYSTVNHVEKHSQINRDMLAGSAPLG